MELAVLQFINEHMHSNSFFNGLFKSITYFGERGIFAVGVCAALTAFYKPRAVGVYALSALAIDYLILNLLLKPTFDRARPFALDSSIADFLKSINCPVPKDPSFPSGHTGVMFALAFALYFRFGGKITAPLFALSAAVALSRVYLCVHYPTDVLGGMCVGCVSAILAAHLPPFKARDNGQLWKDLSVKS